MDGLVQKLSAQEYDCTSNTKRRSWDDKFWKIKLTKLIKDTIYTGTFEKNVQSQEGYLPRNT